jgi:RNA polymerase sigma factor (sigma-70 family)
MPGVSALLQRAQQDGRSAFDRLQKSMEPRLRRFIERLIGRQTAVDEIAQETFLALYVKLERITSEDHLWPFVFRIARHLCYDELRRPPGIEITPIRYSRGKVGAKHTQGRPCPVSEWSGGH